ncbi:MAG TPA: hypothetical protein DDY39_09315 [Nitrospira sp.]|jgi:hypothetical protein|nr:hypothetical protein [Nitrospira sp.]HBR51586.1 hypothetical protein [Nitrospira sp.]
MGESVPVHGTDPFSRSPSMGVLSKPRLELRIGSNIFRNTNGVVTIHGKEQLVVELKPELGQLLITLDLYSEQGVRIAHLRRNVLTVNERGRFAVAMSHSQTLPAIQLSDLRSGDPALEVHMMSVHRVDLVCGKLFSHKGMPVEITPHYCRIGSHTTLFGEILDMRGGPAILG